jgi:hypothetical protein
MTLVCERENDDFVGQIASFFAFFIWVIEEFFTDDIHTQKGYLHQKVRLTLFDPYKDVQTVVHLPLSAQWKHKREIVK